MMKLTLGVNSLICYQYRSKHYVYLLVKNAGKRTTALQPLLEILTTDGLLSI